MYKHLLNTLLFLCFHTLMHAQLEVTSGDTPPFDPEIILENFFFGGGVEVLDISYNGADNAVGFFEGENSNIGLDRGILLTTGDAMNAIGPNTETNISGENLLQGEEDLEQLISNPAINDPAIYEIRFIPFDTIVRFTYVWASDEYPEFAPPYGSTFNDVFGFFISGPGINGPFSNNAENIAFLPDGFTPVSINNVNAVTNSAFYQSNLGGATVEYDGFTIPLEASAIVVPCDTYDIKIAVADAGDDVFDSAVFLASGSFGTDALNISVNTFAADSTMIEGCVGAVIEFALGIPAEADLPLDYNIYGVAQNGIDYDPVPLNAFIPAGEDTLSLFFNPIEDGIAEGLEAIFIDVKTNICGRDTFAIYINDNQLIPPDLGNDVTICEGESMEYDATLPIQLPESVTFTNNQTMAISDGDAVNPALSNIEILGAIPEQVSEGSILSVCLDITHGWDADLDIFLISPSGLFIALSRDNGGSGDNYTQTCFTPTSVTPIEGLGTADAPFTGDFLPESPWEDIYGADMNGVWTLQVSDDSNGFVGTLNSWSMTLPPIYSIGYLWEPADGVSNPNLPNVDLSPTTTTTYTVTAFDTYGCTTQDEVTINVNSSLPAPVISCDNSANGQVTFSWDAVAGATDYEVSVDGAAWVAANGGTSHTVTGLADGQVVSIEVQGTNGGGCGTLSAILDCTAVLVGCALTGNIDDTQNATCFGGNDGQFTVSATSGTQPYTFQIPGTISPSGTFMDLQAGTYNVSITDNAGCATTQIITINQPDSLQFSISINAISCNGENDASITFDASGGTTDYEYSIDGTNFQTNNTFENLTAATYPLIVNDANGCEVSASLTIQEPPAITLMPSFTSALCNGSADGTATVTPMGGTPSFAYTWDANAGNQNTQTATGLAAGTYTVTLTDANNCEATTQVTVDEPGAIILNSSNTAASCNGGTDGTATITANNGATPYTYLWDSNASNQNGPTAVGLAFGSYNITVSDANGCTATDQVDVPELSSIEFTTDATPLNCFGDTNGTATVEITSGTQPFNYTWNTNPPQNTPVATDLPSGTYTITITDGGGCSEITSIDITEPDELTVNLTSTNALCAGENGTINSSVAGGTGTYTYSWDNGMNTPDISPTAGTYILTVTDNNGCTATAQTTLTAPAAFSFTATPSDALCNGSDDGTITIIASGGIAPYQYSIDGGTTFQTNNIFENLPTGAYSLIVNDANNCSDNQELMIGEADAITLMSSNTAASCNGGTDGTATITANNGTTPYTYLWDSNASNQNGPTAVGLALGTYIVTVTDANSCQATGQVDVPELSSLEFTTNIIPLNCFGDTDATASVEITSGTQPYTYLWNTTPVQTTPTAIDLAGGIYTVTITDGGGCSEVVSLDIAEPDELTIDLLTPTNALCAGMEGTISSTVFGGTGSYIYTWDNGMNTADISAIAGSYTLTVTDANGCTATAQSSITEPAAISLTATPTDILCNGNNDATISLSASGGTSNYTYSLDNINFQNNNIFENLAAGTYTVYVNDDNNCTANQELIINEPDALTLILDSTTESCEGDNGTATVTASNGTGNYTYAWSDGQNTPTATTLNAGTYTVTVTDANGCEIMESIEVISEADIQIGVTVTNVSCFGAGDGEASVIAEGIEPITYQWNANAGNQTTPTASNLNAGTYQVIITDANGCMKAEEVIITQPAPISLELTGEDILCNGTATGTASVAAAGGTGSYFYQWDDTNMQQSTQINELTAGTYTVTVTDDNACQMIDSLIINEPTESVSVTGAGSTLDCFGDTNGTISLNAGGGTPPYLYSIDNENFTQGNIFIGLPGGEYTVYATDFTGECTAQGTVTIVEPPELTVDAGEDIQLIFGDSITLEAVPSDSADYIYTWSSFSPELNLSCTDCPTPQARPLNQIMYTVTIENENGCIATDDIRVFINKEQPVFVANAFTPNADGFNDVLYVQGGAAAERVVVFQIFDPWGELVFENRDTAMNNKETGWDGSYRGQEMGSAVFVWYAEVRFVDGSVLPYKGHTTLIR